MKLTATVLFLVFPAIVSAQGTKADYERAQGLRDRLQGLAVDVPGAVTWIEGDRFYYRKSTKGGNVFVLVDAATGKKQAPFDHEKLAASLSAADKAKYTAVTLPLFEFEFADGDKAITFAAAGSLWKCTLADYACSKTGAAPAGAGRGGRGGRGAGPVDESMESPAEFENDVTDGMVQEPSPQQAQGRGGRGQAQAEAAPAGVAR